MNTQFEGFRNPNTQPFGISWLKGHRRGWKGWVNARRVKGKVRRRMAAQSRKVNHVA